MIHIATGTKVGIIEITPNAEGRYNVEYHSTRPNGPWICGGVRNTLDPIRHITNDIKFNTGA